MEERKEDSLDELLQKIPRVGYRIPESSAPTSTPIVSTPAATVLRDDSLRPPGITAGVSRVYRFFRTNVHWHVCWGSAVEVSECKALSEDYWAEKRSWKRTVLSKLATYMFMAFAAWGIFTFLLILGRAL